MIAQRRDRVSTLLTSSNGARCGLDVLESEITMTLHLAFSHTRTDM